jgi:high-affinity nickel-transport protein
VGHTLTIVIVGGAIILLNLTISHTVGLSLELAVAVMLVLLGSLRLVWTLKERDHVRPEHLQAAHDHAAGPAFHSHTHTHDGIPHAHPHLHPSRRLLEALQSVGVAQALRSVGIGLAHGLAGSAAVALLVLSTIHDPYWAAAYLLVFGAGTVLGMMGITAAMTVPFTLTMNRFAWLNRALAFGTGAVSLCLGFFLIYRIGFVERLFTG